ncbi:MAG: hypothetical protein KDK33_04440 [Leptospiraceae bacterium]|nr:hypothetical protein [Leptospiraceae bacterium]
MFHRDYILRLIQEFMVFLGRLMGLKDKNDPDVILLELERSFRQFLGYDSPLLESLGPDGVLAVLSAGDGGSPDQLAIAAILFSEKAKNYAEFNNAPGEERCQRIALKLKEAVGHRPLSTAIAGLLEKV